VCRRKQLTAVAALAVAGGVLAFLAFGGIEKNLVYFWDVDQLLAQGEKAYGSTVRLGGVVQEGTYKWDGEALDLSFNIGMKSAGGNTVPVHARGAPPQMFREGIGVLVEGQFDGKAFTATRVIVKHSNEYQPPAEGERPQDIYRSLIDES